MILAFELFSWHGLIASALCFAATTAFALYWDVVLARLKPHVEDSVDLVERKYGHRLGWFRKFLKRPQEAVASAPQARPAVAVPGRLDWKEVELPALGIRARWAQGRGWSRIEPACPECNTALVVRAAGQLASGDPPRTEVGCPARHFNRSFPMPKEEFMTIFEREVNRTREGDERGTKAC